MIPILMQKPEITHYITPMFTTSNSLGAHYRKLKLVYLLEDKMCLEMLTN